jgi:hypothetical protein
VYQKTRVIVVLFLTLEIRMRIILITLGGAERAQLLVLLIRDSLVQCGTGRLKATFKTIQRYPQAVSLWISLWISCGYPVDKSLGCITDAKQ